MSSSEYGVASMEVVKALSPDVSRPFSPERSGTTLGEGSGAALALPIVEAAARTLGEMATFDAAGVTDKE